MEITAAKIILANLRERVEVGGDGKYRLPGILTQRELDALEFVISGQLDTSAPAPAKLASGADSGHAKSPAHVPATPELQTIAEPNEAVTLDLSTLSLAESDSSYRVCMDFGTAMSKATFVHDGEDDDMEEIQVLKLGVPGDQEQIDEVMLVSSVFIDAQGLLWFGQRAVEQAQIAPEGSNSRMDNIKRALSEDNLGESVSTTYNPTQHQLTYEDIVLAYLAFFTWTINCALLNDIEAPEIAGNFKRRFAMPCFPRANARKVESKLKVLLGEAQVLADTFKEDIHQGLPLPRFLSALNQLRAEKRSYPFIEFSVTEPLGVAGSLLSWQSSQDSLALVVDIGAGTSDFSLYRLNVAVNDDGIKSSAGEVDGTARGITEAGNHLDKILMALILKKSGVDASHPKYRNITHALERDIRFHKESLFSPAAEASITLYTGEAVDVSLDEFLEQPAVRLFEDSLRTTLIEILESAHPDWINWVRANPSRNLTIVLTGGGATLPMAKKLAEGTVTAHGVTIPVAAAKAFPDWLREDYPDLEDHYPRVAVSLGGARKNTIHSMGVLKATGIGIGGYQLDRFPTRGN
jgi:molecular chaperone HscA